MQAAHTLDGATTTAALELVYTPFIPWEGPPREPPRSGHASSAYLGRGDHNSRLGVGPLAQVSAAVDSDEGLSSIVHIQ